LSKGNLSTDRYFNVMCGLLKKIKETQREAILEAVNAIADSLSNGGVLHLFGTGHSQMLVEEAYSRAGGLVPVDAITEDILWPHSGLSTALERTVDSVKVFFDFHNVQKGDVMIIISNSGINAMIVEAAFEAKKRGVKVIAITSLIHTEHPEARHSGRHPSGKRLFEVADIVINNFVPAGDAVLEIEGVGTRVGTGSTITGAAIINAIVCGVAEEMVKRGVEPPILMSNNMEGTEEHDRMLIARYKDRLPLLYYS